MSLLWSKRQVCLLPIIKKIGALYAQDSSPIVLFTECTGINMPSLCPVNWGLENRCKNADTLVTLNALTIVLYL